MPRNRALRSLLHSLSRPLLHHSFLALLHRKGYGDTWWFNWRGARRPRLDLFSLSGWVRLGPDLRGSQFLGTVWTKQTERPDLSSRNARSLARAVEELCSVASPPFLAPALSPLGGLRR